MILTGLPSTGKTTLGKTLVEQLKSTGFDSELIDGDELRRRLPPALGFSRADRLAQAERASYIAELLQRHRVVPVIALVLPYRISRASIKQRLGSACLEVYLKAPLGVCVERDTSGVYRRAKLDGDSGFITILGPYEPPESPELALDTATSSLRQCAAAVMNYLARAAHPQAQPTAPPIAAAASAALASARL